MLRQRTIVAILIVPAAVALVRLGGIIYLLIVLAILVTAALEYARMARAAGAEVSTANLIIGVIVVALGSAFPEQPWLEPALAFFLILTTGWEAFKFERGARTPLTNWAATLAGGCYLGYLGGFLGALRELPNGFWWTMTVLPAVWLADTGAYVIGSLIGKHRMTPRLSPKKSWEGFIGGVVLGTIITALIASGWGSASDPGSGLSWQVGATLGFLIAVISPVGDLGISMFKRQVQFKDTGSLLAGHGGVLDRVDSWLVAAAIGYFYINWFVI